MNITLEEFKKIFSKSVYEKIVKESDGRNEKDRITYTEFMVIIEELYDEIIAKNYSPSSPKYRLFLPKSAFVARIINVLEIKDEAFYYFALKQIEDYIAENRVQNTFGGWRLQKKIKEMEQNDIDELEYVYGSYNPWLWIENWRECQRISYSLANSGDFEYVIKTDISNFYDSINLNILENKLMAEVDKEEIWKVNYLMYFLKYWNKVVDDYKPRSVGIPQTEFGDQSRLLANFYLQEYDKVIKDICDENGAKYIRYADDQYIFVKSNQYQPIIYKMNNELNKIGLNLNCSKTIKMPINDFKKYFLYECFELLDLKQYDKSFNVFFELYDRENLKIKKESYIKRIFSKNIGLDKFNEENRIKIVNVIFDEEILMSLNWKYYTRIYESLGVKDKEKFLESLFFLCNKVPFNSLKINFDKFLKQENITEEEMLNAIL